jgi:hypothetical protein
VHKTSSQASKYSLVQGTAVVDIPATAEEVQERTLQPDPGTPDQNSPGPVDPDIAAADIGPAALAAVAAPAGHTVAGSAQGKRELGSLGEREPSRPGPHSG